MMSVLKNIVAQAPTTRHTRRRSMNPAVCQVRLSLCIAVGRHYGLSHQLARRTLRYGPIAITICVSRGTHPCSFHVRLLMCEQGVVSRS
jgi:hypothetical protein